MGIDAGPWTSRGAIFSDDRRYRYRLWCEWDPLLPRCTIIGLNPSKADEHKLDPTARRAVGFAKHWQCGRLDIVNAFALVSTDPSPLFNALDPVGPDNDRHIEEACVAASIVVAAWSGILDDFNVRRTRLRAILHPTPLVCLGMTKTGHPKHPLRIAQSTPLERFAWGAS